MPVNSRPSLPGVGHGRSLWKLTTLLLYAEQRALLSRVGKEERPVPLVTAAVLPEIRRHVSCLDLLPMAQESSLCWVRALLP